MIRKAQTSALTPLPPDPSLPLTPYHLSLIFLFLLLLTFSFPFSLPSQDFFQIKDDIIEQAWIKKSIFYISPVLRVNNAGYNSNIFSYEYLDAPDWSADVALETDISVILKNRLILQVREIPSYSFYRDNENERSFNNIFQFTAYTRLGRLNLMYRLEKPYVHDQLNPESGWRVRRWETIHTVSADYGSHSHFYLNVYARQRKVSYKDELFMDTFNMDRLFARTEYWAGVGLNKIIFTRTRFTFQAEYYDHRYPFAPVRDRTGGQFSMSLVLPAGSNVTGTLRYGIRFTRPGYATHRDFIKPYGSGTLIIRLLQRYRLNFGYQLDNRYSFAGADLVYDTQSVSAGLTVAVMRRLQLSYTYFIGQRIYTLLSSEAENRRDTFNMSTAALHVPLSDKAQIGVEYRAYRTDSTSLRYLRSYDYIGGYIRYDF